LLGRIVRWVVLRLMGGLGPVGRRLDSSGSLSVFINRLSSSMATQRGLLLMIGTGILIVSLIAHALVLFLLVMSDSFSSDLYWLCIPFGLLHMGVLVGFIGIMLAVPLGQGYKNDQ
jgi:di/tricarboxylate transporter